MPIIRFVAVAGAILLALLFVADASMKPRGPLFTNNSEGLPRSEPVRTQQAQHTPETSRPRAPALVQIAPQEPVRATKPAAPPIAEIAEVETPPATAQAGANVAKSEVVKSEVANTESARIETAGIETTKTETAKTEATKAEPAKVESAAIETSELEASPTEFANNPAPKAAQKETIRTAPAKTRKQVARRLERASRYAYRDNSRSQDDAPVENGYAYGVSPRRQRAESQRPWEGESGDFRFRF